MSRSLVALMLIAAWAVPPGTAANPTIDMTAEELRDRIRGGLLGQILGNLNGIPHEMKYIDEPGSLAEYTPALPEGARTDDDTDFEWVYILAMQRENEIFLPAHRIAELWRERINRRIWCSNRYARHLMDLGIEPPLTGSAALNPWADFNISGQFLSESFALLAPAMPPTAARIALNYTRVAIDLEPAQTTQFFTTMISTAFVEPDVNRILDAGYDALAPRSQIRGIVNDVRQWRRLYPNEWQTTRRLVKEKYSKHGGGMRDRNGFELNTAATVAALLYGDGDFAATLRTAFNFGWDADNTAATAGTIVGVIKGYRWMLAQGWRIVDRYENTTRENMPMDETITSFADRLIDLAERVIVDNGGQRRIVRGQPVYSIRTQQPASVTSLPSGEEQRSDLRRQYGPEIEVDIGAGAEPQRKARAAYLAIALDLHGDLQARRPNEWKEAVTALSTYWRVLQNIYWDEDIPGVLPLRERATTAGLEKPSEKRPVW